MSWFLIAFIILIALIVLCIVVKLILGQKLQDIDGLGKVREIDSTNNQTKVIGHFGDAG